MGIIILAIHGTKDGGTKDGGTKDGGNKGRGDGPDHGRLANHKNSAARRRLCAVLQVSPRLPRDNTDGDLDANPRRRAPLSRRARSVSIMPATARSCRLANEKPFPYKTKLGFQRGVQLDHRSSGSPPAYMTPRGTPGGPDPPAARAGPLQCLQWLPRLPHPWELLRDPGEDGCRT